MMLTRSAKHAKDKKKDATYSDSNNNSENASLDKHETYVAPPLEIVWRSVIIIGSIHMFAVLGAYYLITGHVSLGTFVIGYIHGTISAIGITAGAHRLFAHRAYKAKVPLRILLTYLNFVACQNCIYEWVRDHRVHHKFTETNADPHNALRGFFFAHVGWLLVKKHEDVKVKGKTVDMSDLEADPIVMFQKKYFVVGAITISFIIPTLLPWIFIGDSFFICWCATMTRYALTLNFTWLVNSAAHLYGSHPYDKNINPTENVAVAILASGEGWHNYHHVFPYDYKAAELGNYRMNPTTAFIDFCAWIGQAYDLKTVPKNVVLARVARTGDGTHDY